jgi:hypothetical protein
MSTYPVSFRPQSAFSAVQQKPAIRHRQSLRPLSLPEIPFTRTLLLPQLPHSHDRNSPFNPTISISPKTRREVRARSKAKINFYDIALHFLTILSADVDCCPAPLWFLQHLCLRFKAVNPAAEPNQIKDRSTPAAPSTCLTRLNSHNGFNDDQTTNDDSDDDDVFFSSLPLFFPDILST